MGARIGHGIERALHHGQERKLGGHAALLQFLDDVIEIALAAFHHALDVARLARVPDLPVLHHGVGQVGHGKAGADAVPQIGGHCRQVDGGNGAQAVLDLPGRGTGRILDRGGPGGRGFHRARCRRPRRGRGHRRSGISDRRGGGGRSVRRLERNGRRVGLHLRYGAAGTKRDKDDRRKCKADGRGEAQCRHSASWRI